MHHLRRTCLAAILLSMCFASPLRAEDPPGPFKVKLKLMGDNQMIALRYKAATGEAWILQTGNWRKILEIEPVPAGEYHVELAVGINAWQAIRYDAKSGSSWRLSSTQWQPIRELGGTEIRE